MVEMIVDRGMDGGELLQGFDVSEFGHRLLPSAKWLMRIFGPIVLPAPALAYNLANFMRTLALPKEIEHWSLTTLREKLVKIGAKVVSHGRYVTFQLAEVAVPRELFRKILSLIDDLRRRPVPA